VTAPTASLEFEGEVVGKFLNALKVRVYSRVRDDVANLWNGNDIELAILAAREFAL
jgi:hypothetical protein